MDCLTIFLTICTGVFVIYGGILGTKLWSTKPKSGLLDFSRYVLLYVYFAFLRPTKKRLLEYYPWGKTAETLGFFPTLSERELELPRKISGAPESTDGITFTGTDKTGALLVVKIDRKPNRTTEVWLILRLPDGRTYNLPQHPDTLSISTNNESFSSSGLLVECSEPMRHWRVCYNGLLKKTGTTGNKEDDVAHIRFNLRWKPLSIGVDYMRDISPALMAKALMEEGIFQLFVLDDKMRYSNINQYDQYGMFYGDLSVGDEDPSKLELRGLKNRCLDFRYWNLLNDCTELSGYCENGDSFKLVLSNYSHGFTNITYGFIFRSRSVMNMIEACTFSFNLTKELETRGEVTIQCKTEVTEYTLTISLEREKFPLCVGDRLEAEVVIHPTKFALNGKRGHGIAMFSHRRKQPCLIERPKQFPLLPEIESTGIMNIPLALNFKDKQCRDSSIVGGKGSSLASLLAMEQHEFLVSPGFCLTTAAYYKHLKENSFLQKAIEKLATAVSKQEKVQEESKKVIELFEKTSIKAEILDAALNQLWKMYGPKYKDILFAVRSSAIGEDSADLSAAGQNETFLGVKGPQHMELAIRKCWASQFAFQALEYKRQYGQPIDSGMSVVVQEMVPCEVAGVMFTRDPASGSPGIITITANFGLGESVVSASAEPDTIQVNRTWNNKLSLKDKQVGAKASKIQVKKDGGTEEISIPVTISSKCCLPDEMILRIAEMGIMVEQAFGDSRDIEFGISKGEIYMLQARPITSLYQDTDDELKEEFDTPYMTDHEYSTNANVAEVFPGCVRPLSFTTTLQQFFVVMQQTQYYKLPKYAYDFQTYVMQGWVVRYTHVLLSMVDMFVLLNASQDKAANEAFEISLFGSIKGLDDMYESAMERYGQTTLYTYLYEIYEKYRVCFCNNKSLKYGMDKLYNYKIPVEGLSTSAQCFEQIKNDISVVMEAGRIHLDCSMASNHYNAWIMQLLPCTTQEELLGGTAQLLSSCSGVVSADVPQSLEKLAITISKDPEATKFMEMNVEDGLKWLQKHPGGSGEEFAEFLEKHGHRCVNEFELYLKTWGLDPTPVIDNLQNMVKYASKLDVNKKVLTSDEAIDSLGIDLPFRNRKILKFLLPFARKSVGNREQSKSLTIKVTHNFRLAYRHLGQMLVNEGRLPDLELVFLLTQWELFQLIKTRSPTLVSKAIRRKRVYKAMDEMKFNELNFGRPQVMDDTQQMNGNVITGSRVNGSPVSKGVIQATARVIHNVKEAKQIQPGDILITYATDIAWSPFFPLLSGVVTEMGGLISHGAVVAREFGLPCIVNAKTATQVFKSGDTVILNATKGFIEKVEKAD